MTSQPGLQTIAIHTIQNLVNNYDMTTEIFFFKNHAENEARRLVPDLFLFFKKA